MGSVEQQLISTAAQQGIAFFIMACAIVGLLAYLKILDKRADERAKADQLARENQQKRDDERIAEQNAREDKRIERQEAAYTNLITQVMDQQKTMMGLLFGVVNRNSNVQEKMVETLKNGPTGSEGITPNGS